MPVVRVAQRMDEVVPIGLALGHAVTLPCEDGPIVSLRLSTVMEFIGRSRQLLYAQICADRGKTLCHKLGSVVGHEVSGWYTIEYNPFFESDIGHMERGRFGQSDSPIHLGIPVFNYEDVFIPPLCWRKWSKFVHSGEPRLPCRR